MSIFVVAFLCIIAFIVYRPAKFTEGGIAVLGLFALLLLSLLQWVDIPTALVGTEFLRPFEIVMILITLAVLSTTLDDHGFFKYAAYKAILWSKNDGKVLFTNFFILTIVLTTFTSNDVDVLTLTPIIIWFSVITKINPIPYLFAGFVAANTSSMEFLIGNLTNIVVGSVFELGFIEFFVVMILPTIATLFVQYWILILMFRKQLPKKLLNKDEMSQIKKKLEQPLPNKRQNIFVIVVLFLVILGGALSDFFPIELWMVTSFGALLVLLSNEFNLRDRLKVIPWDVVVFVLVFIVLTNKLQMIGAIDTAASYFGDTLSTFWGGLFFSSFFSAFTSGVINNIPASISLSTVFHSLVFEVADAATIKGVAYGLVIGTNLGSFLSPVGALATILWMSIIRKKGFEFPLKLFIKYGLIIGVSSIFVASLVVGLELALFL